MHKHVLQGNKKGKKKGVPEGCITSDQFHTLFMLPLPVDLTKTQPIAVDILVQKFIRVLRQAVAARKSSAKAKAKK